MFLRIISFKEEKTNEKCQKVTCHRDGNSYCSHSSTWGGFCSCTDSATTSAAATTPSATSTTKVTYTVDDEEVTADTEAKKNPALKLNTVTDAGKTAAITVSGTTRKVYVIPGILRL
ncbi:MAG: hypothetical protein FRC54_08110 [bacterium LCO1.1]|uniref:Uncharacterized protein n=1 Tax=Candidatus Weimeria bifida TaxID=2599074 RepID=A0A6N7J1E2_9FIRM|nr:hypothetical protein [Candidatus Weimeria bifida]